MSDERFDTEYQQKFGGVECVQTVSYNRENSVILRDWKIFFFLIFCFRLPISSKKNGFMDLC